MIVIEIPGREPFENQPCGPGLQRDSGSGRHAAEGVKERIARLKELAHVYVLTADTYGTVTRQCEPLGITVRTFPREGAAGCKEEIVKGLEGGVACLGNGFNDIPMFDAARLSIAVLEREGMCAALLSHASVVVRSIEDGLDLLLKPDRLRATLRS